MVRWLRRGAQSHAVDSVWDHTDADETRTDRMSEPIRMDLNRCATEGIVGWALHPSGVRSIRVSLDEAPVGMATLGLSRPDVAAAFGHAPHTEKSGFAFTFPMDAFAGRHLTTELRIDIEAADGSSMTVQRLLEPFPPLGWGEDAAAALAAGPFPASVAGALRRLRPDTYDGHTDWNDELI